MLELNAVNPRIIGVDPNNEVDLWLQYIYTSAPDEVAQLLRENGIDATSPSEAI